MGKQISNFLLSFNFRRLKSSLKHLYLLLSKELLGLNVRKASCLGIQLGLFGLIKGLKALKLKASCQFSNLELVSQSFSLLQSGKFLSFDSGEARCFLFSSNPLGLLFSGQSVGLLLSGQGSSLLGSSDACSLLSCDSCSLLLGCEPGGFKLGREAVSLLLNGSLFSFKSGTSSCLLFVLETVGLFSRGRKCFLFLCDSGNFLL